MTRDEAWKIIQALRDKELTVPQAEALAKALELCAADPLVRREDVVQLLRPARPPAPRGLPPADDATMRRIRAWLDDALQPGETHVPHPGRLQPNVISAVQYRCRKRGWTFKMETQLDGTTFHVTSPFGT